MLKLPQTWGYTGRSIKFRDTQGLIYSIKIIDLDSPYREKDVIDCRLYSAHSSHVVHCALWVCDPSMGCYGSGVGKAGGYGYHKGSAAIEAALRDLGLSDFRSFAGGGYEMALAVLLEFAGELGYTNTLPIITYP
jgi:hypothetical protein